MNKRKFSRIITLWILTLFLAACSTPPAPSTIATSSATTTAPTSIPTSGPTSAVDTSAQSLSDIDLFEFNTILGRPTDHSISVSLYSKTDKQVTIDLGTSSGAYDTHSGIITLKANLPQVLELDDLNSDTDYFYRLVIDGTPQSEHSFHTQRPAGSTFTFTVDADPHNREPNFNGDLYITTLTNAALDNPDFHIDLGDTFMTEKINPKSYQEAETTFSDMRPYFGVIGADTPVFLVNGNHEGEVGWSFKNQSSDLKLWSTQLRQLYYPNPLINSFYSGAASMDPTLNQIRDGYYAWTWGDAQFIVLDPFWYTEKKPQPDEPESSWNWTLGREQYDWLRTTLQNSTSKYKFVFIHNLVGGSTKDARGGIEAAPYFEWGGSNSDGSYGFDQFRPGWGVPIHQLLVENHVSAVFHGHDHVFVKQELDGIIYQEVPQPNVSGCTTRMAEEYGYKQGEVFCGSGYLRIMVSPEKTTVDYLRSFLPQDETADLRNGMLQLEYNIFPQ